MPPIALATTFGNCVTFPTHPLAQGVPVVLKPVGQPSRADAAICHSSPAIGPTASSLVSVTSRISQADQSGQGEIHGQMGV